MKLSGNNTKVVAPATNKKFMEMIDGLLASYYDDLLIKLDEYYQQGPNADIELLIDQVKKQVHKIEKARYLLAKDFL